MVVDQLRTEMAVAQAPPAAVGQAPASDLARLLSGAAQEVLAPRMATAFRLRLGLDRGRPLGPCGLLVAQAETMVGDFGWGATVPGCFVNGPSAAFSRAARPVRR